MFVLDEFGYFIASKTGAEPLFEIFTTAYERASVVLINNLAFEQRTEVLGPERLAGVARDQLTHRCVLVGTSGE
ncbi:MAG: ATP-binding protein [Gemmataceae bacterium]|nr:ATP-binding protein [Gemmataceae bacterium]